MNGTRKISNPAANWAQLRKKSLSNQPRLMKGKYLCIVTGAANGFGRAISSTVFQDNGLFPNAMAGSRVILIDNDEEGLKETSGKKMRQFLKHRRIEVDLVTIDLSDLGELKARLEKVLNGLDKDFEEVLFINHASSLADVSKDLIDLTEVNDIHQFWQLNLTARVYITTAISRMFSFSRRTIVMVSNTDFSQSTPYLGLNSMASSAIKTFAETFAKENKNVRMLHYTPSRVDSNKTKTLVEKCANETLKVEIANDYETKKLMTPETAAKKLIKHIEDNVVGKKGNCEIISDSD